MRKGGRPAGGRCSALAREGRSDVNGLICAAELVRLGVMPLAWRMLGWIGMGCGLLAAAACAAGNETEPDPTSVVTASTGGATASATGSGGAPGGAGGMDNDLCAQDCDAIDTPPCFVAVCNEGGYQGPIGQCVVVNDRD